ncbi:MAG: hypothetical protein CVV27_14105, partial [Candidatus Melainabacteria bacterium HGW-Melainabacteria-1]
MRKDLPWERLGESWRRASLSGQIAGFWLTVLCGAAALAGLLWLCAGRPAAIPAWAEAAYVAGLYAWLWLLCAWARRLAGLPPWRSLNPMPLALGAGLGMLCLGLLWGLSLGAGWASVGRLAQSWPQLVLQACLMAIAVAMIEERVFRGLMLDLGRRRLSERAATHLQAGIYALPHLLRSDLSLTAWLNALVSLWLTGLLLAKLRKGNDLSCGLGLHAAWIGCSSFAATAGLLVWPPAFHSLSGGG